MPTRASSTSPTARPPARRSSTVAIPAAQNAVARYPIAVIKATKDQALAQAFMSYVLGSTGSGRARRMPASRRTMTRARRRPPLPVVAVAAVTVAFFALPARRPARPGVVVDARATTSPTPEARTALRLSLVCSLSATALSVAFGLPLAWVLARVTFPGRALVRAPRAAAAGAAPGGRRRGAARRVQPPRHRRRAPLRLVRDPAHVHHRRGRSWPRRSWRCPSS